MKTVLQSLFFYVFDGKKNLSHKTNYTIDINYADYFFLCKLPNEG